MLLPSQPSNFFVHPSAITFGFNALGDPDNISITVYANAQVTMFVRDIDGLDKLPDNEYRSWSLSAYPTHFTDAAGCARYCHIALSNTTNQASLCFPDTRLDIFGRAITDDCTAFLADDGTALPDDAEEPASSSDYWFLFVGKITASGPSGQKVQRKWDTSGDYPITGTLNTAHYWEYDQTGEFDQMFRLDLFNDVIRVLKAFHSLIIRDSLEVFKSFTLAGSRIVGFFRSDTPDPSTPTASTSPTSSPDLDDLVPTEAHVRAYTDQNFLSKKKGGTVEADVTFNQDVTIDGALSVGEDLTVHGDLSATDITASGNVGSRVFNKDIILGEGWQVDQEGNIVADSMTLRKFAEFPELRYNRINIHVGVDWQTTGAGLIESVDAERQIVTLKLEAGEYGTIQKGHLCMGIWHHLEGNDTETLDERNGNFHFAGFRTVYFEVVDFCNEDGTEILDTPDTEGKYNKRYFKYALREDWPSVHPCAMMSFAAYAHRTNPDYQWCAYQTPQYLILLSGMVDWTYGQSNIAYVRGYLQGFTIVRRDGTPVPLEGIGIGVGKIYRWGTETYIDREAQLLNQQLYYCRSAKPSEVFLAELSKASWTTTPLSPTVEEPYVYGYWVKTYTENGDEYTVPASGKPSAKDVFMIGSVGLTGESAVGLTLDRSVIVVNTEKSEWDDDDEEAMPELSGVQTATVTATMTYGTMREDISHVEVGKVDGVTVKTEVKTNKAVLQIEIGDGFDAARESQLRVTFHSAHTDKDGVTAIIVLHPAIDGRDGQEGEAGVGVSRIVEEYVATATDGEQPAESFVGAATPSQAGFSAEKCVLWNRTTTYNTDNLITARTPWAVISRWGEDGKNGEDGLTITVDGADVIFKDDEKTAAAKIHKVRVSVSRGDTPLEYASGTTDESHFLCGVLNNGDRNIDGKVIWSFEVVENVFAYTLIRATRFDGVLDIPFWIEVNGQKYHRTIHAICLSEPTVYEIEPSQPNFVFKDDEPTVSGMVSFRFYSKVGSLPRQSLRCSFNLYALDADGNFTVLPKSGINASSASISNFPNTTRYIKCEIIVNGNTEKTLTIVGVNAGQQGMRGPAGLDGPFILPRGQWKPDTEYVNWSSAEDNRRIDAVYWQHNGTTHQFLRTEAEYPYTITEDGVVVTYFVGPYDSHRFIDRDGSYYIDDENGTVSWSRWWKESDTNVDILATRVLLAENASIDFLSGQSMFCYDKPEDGGVPQIVVGMQGAKQVNGVDVPQIFAGAKDGNALEASYRVYGDGTLYALKAFIEGYVNATSGKMDDIEIGQKGVWVGDPKGIHIIIRTDGGTPAIDMLNDTTKLFTIRAQGNHAELQFGSSNAVITEDRISLMGGYIQMYSSNSESYVKIGNSLNISVSGGQTTINGLSLPSVAYDKGSVYVDEDGYIRLKK